MVMRGVGREIVLVDYSAERAAAEADDIFHAVPFAHPMHVSAGTYNDLEGCRVVVIAAGVGQKPGETRLQLLERNAAVFASIVPQILKAAPNAILVVATNPVDVMTHITAKIATREKADPARVIGSGTTLDTARFRTLLGSALGVDPHHVHAYVIGEHGDSEVLSWSTVTIAGVSLEEFCKLRKVTLDEEARANIDHRVRRAAYHIIQGKGATYYGIGSALTRIVDVILHDQRAILTVCSATPDVQGIKDITLSLPRLVGGDGVLATAPQSLSLLEQQQLRASAEVLEAAIHSICN
jgi:L-lactate dehydrogenase